MSSRKLCPAAVSQRIDYWQERNETRDALDQSIVAWLAKAGIAAFPVPNALSASPVSDLCVEAWLEELTPELVLLSGGNNVGEFPERDSTEKAMLDWAERNRRPVLGICRGMQLMGTTVGGKLAGLAGHVRTHHNLGDDWPGRVNSFHNFGFMECPPGYRVLSRAEDGSIEAMRHQTLPWEGWMWHPEREVHRAQDIQRLLDLLNHE